MTMRRPLLALAVLLGTLWSLWWFVGRAALRAEPKLPDEICFVAPAVPYDPRSGLQPHAPRPVPANARCPVCGAFPSRVPGWAEQLIFANGDAYFFDSPLTLFIYLRNLQRYAPGRQASEVAASYVHAMGDGGWLPALQAVYVSGSTALGPMRRGNLPAFRNLADAQQFIARNGGVVVHPADITADRLEDVEPHRMHRAADPIQGSSVFAEPRGTTANRAARSCERIGFERGHRHRAGRLFADKRAFKASSLRFDGQTGAG